LNQVIEKFGQLWERKKNIG